MIFGLDSGDAATWVGSVGIVLTLGATTWQIGHEARARRSERHREQAISVSAWYSGERETGATNPAEARVESWLTVANLSNQPIYEVVLTLVLVQGAAPRTGEDWTKLKNDGPQLPFGRVFAAVGPGTWEVSVSAGWAVHQARPGAEIGFTDGRGGHWIRRANGKLVEIQTNAIDHYGVQRPIDFDVADART